MAKHQTMKYMLQRSIILMGDHSVGIQACGGSLRGGGVNLLRHWTVNNFGTSACVADKKIDKVTAVDFMAERNSLGLGDKLYGKFQRVSPQKVSRRLEVPGNIALPDYWFRADGKPPKPVGKKPHIKTEEEVKLMRESCRLAKLVLEETLSRAKPGVTTDDLDKFAHGLAIKNKAFPSALTYRQFPKSICTSVNNVACHGIPDDRKLVDGDIITVDVMVYKNGFHGDCAGTVMVGNVDEQGQKLVKIAEECLAVGIKQCGPGVLLENIGKAIEDHANESDVSVLHVFTGHGVGRNIHEQPDIYHYDRPDKEKNTMKPGMTFTIEPVITQGMDLVMILNDGWTAVTIDGARAAQFEHTILITESGYEILTVC